LLAFVLVLPTFRLPLHRHLLGVELLSRRRRRPRQPVRTSPRKRQDVSRPAPATSNASRDSLRERPVVDNRKKTLAIEFSEIAARSRGHLRGLKKRKRREYEAAVKLVR